MQKTHNRSFITLSLNLLLISSVVFFVIAVIIASYMFFSGEVFISTADVVIEIEGAEQARAGDQVELTVLIENNTRATLEDVEATFVYPEGAYDPGNPGTPLSRLNASLGDLAPGDQETTDVAFTLFGEEGREVVFLTQIEYNIERSNARLTQEVQHSIFLGDAPLSLSIDGPSSAHVGEDVSYTVTVTSHQDEAIEGIVIVPEYPESFSPNAGTDEWRVDSLDPGAEHDVEVSGSFFEYVDEEGGRTLSFSAGLSSDVSTHIAMASHVLELEREPFIFSFDLFDTEHVEPGDVIEGVLLWQNNSSEAVTDAELSVTFPEDLVDDDSISASGAEFDEDSRALVWSGDDLADRLSEDRAEVGFSVRVSADERVFRERQTQSVDLEASLEASTMRGGEISLNASARALISSRLGLSVQSLHHEGGFDNSGPLPPRVGSETTYTIVFDVTSTVGPLSNVQLVADLPSYVTWKRHDAPGTVIYDEDAHSVTWTIGRLRGGTGFVGSPLRGRFQVGLIPEEDQVRTAPFLLGNIVLTGLDEYTGVTQTHEIDPPTTRLIHDGRASEDEHEVEE